MYYIKSDVEIKKYIKLNWISEHYQWIFSGIGILILSLIFTLFKKKEKLKPKNENKLKNSIKAKKVNINQTIISNSNIGDIQSKIDKSNSKLKNLDLDKVKKNDRKNKFRTFIIKKLASERMKNSVLEIRHITDLGEKELGLEHEDTFNELEKIEEEGLIKFIVGEDEFSGPYTRIKLTKKYFKVIKNQKL